MPIDIFRADVATCKWSQGWVSAILTVLVVVILRSCLTLPGFSPPFPSLFLSLPSPPLCSLLLSSLPLPPTFSPFFETGSCYMSLIYLENRLDLNFIKLAPLECLGYLPHDAALKYI